MKYLIRLTIILFSFYLGTSVINAQSVMLEEVISKMKISDGYNNYISHGYTIEFIQTSSSFQIITTLDGNNEVLTFNFEENIISVSSADVIPEKEIYDNNDHSQLQYYEYWFAEIVFASGNILGMSIEDCQNFLSDENGGTRSLSLVNDGIEISEKDYTFIFNPGDEPHVINYFSQFKFDLDNPFGQGTPYEPSEVEPNPEPEI